MTLIKPLVLTKPITDKKDGFDMQDAMRAGKSRELDSLRVSIAMVRIEEKLNEIIDVINNNSKVKPSHKYC